MRNPAAYLAGVLRRGSRRNDPPPSSSRHEEDQSRNSDSADPLSLITPGAVAKLREVGVLSGPNSLDDRSLGTLVRLPPEVQFLVADTFTKRRLEGIRSMSGVTSSYIIYWEVFSPFIASMSYNRSAERALIRAHNCLIHSHCIALLHLSFHTHRDPNLLFTTLLPLSQPTLHPT